MNADFIFLTVSCFIVITLATVVVRARYRREFLVNEGFVGLLYRRGKLVAAFAPGLYARWGTHFRLQCLDRRQVLLAVAGQEVLTADNVAVKLSVVLTTQLVDAAKAVQTADNHTGHIYSATQTAIRTAVAGATLEALLGQRVALGAQLRELVAPAAAALGVQIHAAEVRDVMLPGDLRKAFSETLKARQQGQAALERARGESAALRNLANAARLLEDHPALATLRFLQTLEAAEGRQTLVMNDLAPLLATHKTRGASDPGPSATEN
ncbi:band 7 protein [Chthoniobacter flavus Ellin428]|uniref:Band 7 protein n=1 Tax=Chthoniobacter flavus Ellin428 TaxID=497964 RepID=B4D4H1_9BACT|nr:slipin family protein [Chthoniobacter flavus]EDY18772.1 band 7 protein [Chthoniobacter flavus Ellin428]TCO88992.1 regulator of protease activity HflC (stomatin/prohibitin superfamily) [Chthoniobacter flavus]